MILARIYELTGQLDIAIGWALRASERRPDIAEINWMVAELYARIGDFDQAAKYEPAPGIGQLFWQRKYQQLIDLGEDLLFERPGELQTIYTLAHAYNATGRFDQAARILTGAGLPETALIDTRRAADEAALVQLADAQFALGQADEANEFAQWTVEFMFKLNLTNGSDAWWPLIYSACAYSILDQPDRMMDSLEVAMKDAGLPWYPLVADMACFQRHRENQRYVEVVEDLGRRMQELRQKLPSTLASMGVTAQ